MTILEQNAQTLINLYHQLLSIADKNSEDISRVFLASTLTHITQLHAKLGLPTQPSSTTKVSEDN